jgi:hypothetical protein
LLKFKLRNLLLREELQLHINSKVKKLKPSSELFEEGFFILSQFH